MPLNRSSITICLLVLLTGFGGLLVSLSSLYLYLSPKLPAVETLRDIKLSTPLRIYSADGKFIAEFGEIKRIPVSIEEVPPLLIKALIAIEDDRFYSHNGVDVSAFLRATSQYLLGSSNQTGGSTLTMQVAKNSFLEADGTLLYKANQMLLAMQIEREMSKGEILELYLNQNFLGKRAYGIGAAAQVYYGKTVDQLTLAQMASLVGTFQLPSAVNPLSNPERSLRRRNLVLARMLDLGFIGESEYQRSAAEPLNAEEHDRPIELYAPYVAEMARQEVVASLPDGIYEDGYVVHVTVDSRLQEAAQEAVVNGLLEYDLRHGYRGPEEFKLEPVYLDAEYVEQEQSFSPLNLTSGMSPIGDETKDMAELVTTNESVTIDTESSDRLIDEPAPRIYEIAQLSAGDEKSEAEGQPADAQITESVSYLNVSPWMEELGAIATVADLQPAAVLESQGDKLVVLLADGNDIAISWENGPKQYLRASSRAEPANEKVLSLGDVVRVRKTGGQWHLSQVPAVQGAMVAIDPQNGAIKALVGGFDYSYSNYNRAEQAERQPGSNFKPFLYTAALENGFSAGSIIIDEPISEYDSSLEDYWQPQNDDRKSLGPMRLREALYRSRNVVSIHIRNSLGHATAFKDVGRFGIDYRSLPNNDPTLALGTYEMTPRQVATAYAVLANGGYRVDSYLVDRIETGDGEVLFQARPLTVCRDCENQEKRKARQTADGNALLEEAQSDAIQLQAAELQEPDPVNEVVPANPANELEAQLLAELQQLDSSLDEEQPNPQGATKQQKEEPLPVAPRVIDKRTAYIINDILKDVIQESRGTGRRARVLGREDIAGKTGTTDQSHDLWFSGYTPTLVATSWVGYDEYKPLGEREFGGTAALPPWIEFMREALKGVPEVERPMPAGLEIVRINSQTGKPTGPDDPKAVREIFKVENSPLHKDGESQPLDFNEDEVNPLDIF